MTHGTAATFVARLALVAVSGILTVITSRALGAAGRGTFAEASNAIYLGSAVPSMGLGTANAYFAAGRSVHGALVANSALAAIGAIALAALAVLIGQGTELLASDLVTTLGVLIGIPLFTAAALLTYIVLGSNLIIRYNVLTVLQPTILLGSCLVLLTLGRLDAATATLAMALSQIPVLVLVIRWTLDSQELGPVAPNLELFRRCVAYAGASQVAGLLLLVNSRIGLYLVDPLAGRAEVGVLSVALVITDALAHIPQSITVPLFAESARAPDDASAIARAALVSRVGLLSVAVLAIPMIVLTTVFTPLLFGDEFRAVPGAVLLMLPAAIALAPRMTLWTYMHSVGRPGLVIVPSAAALLTNVVLELMLVPRLGAVGACIAISFSAIVISVALLALQASLTGTALRDFLVPRRDDIRLAVSRARSTLGLASSSS